MTKDTTDMAREVKMPYDFVTGEPINLEKLKAFEALVRADEREIVMNEPLTKAQWQMFEDEIRADERKAIYDLVMEAPFKEFDRQEEDFDGEAANAMKAMAFSLTAAIRARGNT